MKIESFQYFYPEQPFLMAVDQDLFEKLSKDKDWVAEPKINGSRLQLHIIDGKVQFWGRDGELLKYEPNDSLIKALKKLELQGYWLFDGELRHNKTIDIRNRVCLYDVFIQEGELLLGVPFRKRRQILEDLIQEEYPGDELDRQFHHRFTSNLITIPEQYSFGFREIFNHLTQADEIEGLVLKNLNGKLNLGRKAGINSAWMYKIRKASGRYKF